ncbi:MAG: YkgJ family cysteine cluster protein [Elusimicrobiota bacterium]
MPRPKELCKIKLLKKSLNKLNKLYQDIPETKGCMENLPRCQAWCCSIQSPSLLFVEFMNVWDNILHDYSTKEIVGLIKGAVNNYVFFRPDAGCIFFDRNTKYCMCHKYRPYNCRIYGITPEDEFTLRYERFKEQYKDEMYDIRDQCSLVEVRNGQKVTTNDTNKWWERLCKIEHYFGVSKSNINDAPDGTYRNFHDHLLLFLFPDDLLSRLTMLRLNRDLPKEEKKKCIESFIDCLYGIIEKMKNISDEDSD